MRRLSSKVILRLIAEVPAESGEPERFGFQTTLDEGDIEPKVAAMMQRMCESVFDKMHEEGLFGLIEVEESPQLSLLGDDDDA